MLALLLLAAALSGPPCPSTDLVHGLVIDSARVSGGAFVDLWSTEFALSRCPGCKEGNPLGLSRSARTLLKGGLVVAAVTGLHEMRRAGHSGLAKWTGRAIFALQAAVAARNVAQARAR